MRRRGIILPAVLVTLAVGAMIGTTALFYADAGRRGAAAALEGTQVRVLGWSGAQAAMAELAAQREDLLAGELPRLTDEWVAFTTAGGRGGLFRLLPRGEMGELAVSENGKLDLNHAPVEAIGKLPGLSLELAEAIVAARPLSSLEDLLEIEGITRGLVHGEQSPTSEQVSGAGATSEQVGGAGFSGGGGSALADTATVYSFDPNIQSGIEGAGDRGERRLNLNVEWNERLGRALDRRLGDGAGEAVRQIMESGQTFARPSDMVRVLRFFQLPADEWPRVLDALTTTDDEYLPGLVDMNVAPAAVLACLPGMDDEIARAIVDERGAMAPSSRESVCWPLLEELMTPEQFEQAVDHLTTRSTQWRVRVEAGLTARGAMETTVGVDDLAADEFGALMAGAGDRLQRRIELDVVIDVASQRARVAHLRDVTHVELAERLAAERAAQAPVAEQDRAAGRSAEGVDPRSDHLVDLDLETGGGGRMQDGGAAPRDLASGSAEGAPDGGDGGVESDGAGDGAGLESGGDEPQFVDRRRGRWTAGTGGGS